MTKFTAYAIKLQLKKLFIHYYIETLLPRENIFDILLVFVFFLLLTYCGICFFHILFLHFFLLQISFCIYLLFALIIFLYHFHNNLLLYLISRLCFFDNKLIQRNSPHYFLYIVKQKL